MLIGEISGSYFLAQYDEGLVFVNLGQNDLFDVLVRSTVLVNLEKKCQISTNH